MSDLRSQYQRRAHDASIRRQARPQSRYAQRDGTGVVVNGNPLRAQKVSNEALGAGDSVVVSSDGLAQQESRKVQRGGEQGRALEKRGEVKVFFSIQRKNSNIIEYWIGGDRTRPLKIVEHDTTLITAEETNGVSIGKGLKDWIFTIKTVAIGTTNGPRTIQTFSGDGSRQWQITDPKAQYVSWRGLDFWQTFEVQSLTRQDINYSITRAPGGELVRTQISDYQRVSTVSTDGIYLNNLWGLAFSGTRNDTTIDRYRDPPIEGPVATYQSTTFSSTIAESSAFRIWSIYSLNGTLQEKNSFWTETYSLNAASFEEVTRSQTAVITSTTNGTINTTRNASYQVYIAPDKQKPSTVNVFQNTSYYFFLDRNNPGNDINNPGTAMVFASQRIQPYYCFLNGYVYSKSTGAATTYHVGINNVETQVVFPPLTPITITNNTKINCWTVIDNSLQINRAPSIASGLPLGDSVEFGVRAFVSNEFVDASSFTKQLLPINVGQTNDDTVKWLGTQYWGDGT